MSELTQKTLRAITDRRIEPVPRWRTWLERALTWLGVATLVLLAALSTALSLHAIFEIDWDAYAKADFTLFQIILSGVPIFSILFLGLFLWGGALLVQQIGRGYRYPLWSLVLIFFSANVAFGYFIEESPLDEPTERFFLAMIPHGEAPQASLIPSARRQWSQPERGLLSGSVLSSSATSIELRDSEAKLWTVEYAKEELGSDVRLEVDDEIKIIGKQDGEDTFRASEVRTWESSKKTKKSEVVKPKQEEKESDADNEEEEHEDDEDDEDEEGDQSDDDNDDEHDQEED